MQSLCKYQSRHSVRFLFKAGTKFLFCISLVIGHPGNTNMWHENAAGCWLASLPLGCISKVPEPLCTLTILGLTDQSNLPICAYGFTCLWACIYIQHFFSCPHGELHNNAEKAYYVSVLGAGHKPLCVLHTQKFFVLPQRLHRGCSYSGYQLILPTFSWAAECSMKQSRDKLLVLKVRFKLICIMQGNSDRFT